MDAFLCCRSSKPPPSRPIELWRVVSLRKCCLEVRMVNGNVDGIDMTAFPGVAAAGGVQAGSAGGGSLHLSGAASGGHRVILDEEHVHNMAVRAGGCRKRQQRDNDDGDGNDGNDHNGDDNNGNNNNGDHNRGADANPTNNILEHMNVNGMVRQHVRSHLQLSAPPPPQNDRGKQQKRSLEESFVFPNDSPFFKAILPSLKIPAYNHLMPSGAGDGAGPSNVVTMPNFTGSEVSGAPQLWRQAPVSLHGQQWPPAAASNVFASAGNVAPLAAVQAPALGGQQQKFSSGGGQLTPFPVIPQLFFGPFPYQGPVPPALRNKLHLLTTFPAQISMEQPEPELQLPFEQPVGDLFVGQTAGGGAGATIGETYQATTAAYADALQYNGSPNNFMATETLFRTTEPIVSTHGYDTVAVVPEMYTETAAMGATSNNSEPFMLPQVRAAEFAANGEGDDNFMFPLEAFLGPNMDVPRLPHMDVGAGYAAVAGDDADVAALTAEQGGRKTSFDLTPDLESNVFLDELFMNAPVDANDVYGRE
ncbi:hypothetical protein GUJ93_ZPchr0008g13894 [Zizania palustris]|uniref:Uncharacterized protein n=1 Tax=Zizania palustris TaxID=103762 RepID=A0A8J5RP88_ZIZPA|nr:hypothetical protein GUJ93_ZPchr0008g13894 [Zizania palustris]